jgi:hypothetical protein
MSRASAGSCGSSQARKAALDVLPILSQTITGPAAPVCARCAKSSALVTDHPALRLRVPPDPAVVGLAQADFPYRLRVITGSAQPLRESWRPLKRGLAAHCYISGRRAGEM